MKLNIIAAAAFLCALAAASTLVAQANSDSLSKYQALANNGNSNIIEHSSNKQARLEAEKRQLQDFFNTKTIFKVVMKMLFGSPDEVAATSRSVLGMLNQLLNIVKKSFGQKGRSGTARTIRDSAEDVANAGVTMLQGYIKSVMTSDEDCAKRYLCQASQDATREGRELGYIIAAVGGYASSYLLENPKDKKVFAHYFDATKAGRNLNQNCTQIFSQCSEQQ